ncbi:DUF459 domain-containing protein [Novosphingobium sp. FSY-8]|uniref:DUF459 domain-containing protein n=1 Tax=Novosphingobium ovatum TaxID=1908523 RepID=A0ABW9XA75_9SPHN|nr:GDSL-type esterase/lipase family protein [Novosphingobium ovatum]NBC35434.1 DUF459 domain-containing protein [Novosphingobium ovatum]
MNKLFLVLDRTLAVFVGLGMGLVIGLSYGTEGHPWRLLTEGGSKAEPLPGPIQPASASVSACPAAPLASGNVANALREGRALHVGVFGDSFGEGLSAATHNTLIRDKRFIVHGFAKQSTGFTRYRSLNLLDDATDKLNRQKIDIAIISFGANDTQGIWANGHVAPYMSEPWKQVIKDRAGDLVHLLQSRGVVVVWVGLPVMRNPDFDRQTRAMNAFYNDTMCQLGVRYINTLPASVDGQGRFNTFLTDPKDGQRFQARAMDGVHMSMRGYRMLIDPLLKDMQSLKFAGGVGQPAAAPERGQERGRGHAQPHDASQSPDHARGPSPA